MWHVYIVRCNDGSLYTGIAKDPEKRVAMHNDGSGAKYTRARKPVELLYTEPFATKSKAQSREAEIKSFSREDKKKLVESGIGKKSVA